MIYHFINLSTSAFIYLGGYYLDSGNIYPNYGYVSFFPFYIAVFFLFSIYFTPKQNYFYLFDYIQWDENMINNTIIFIKISLIRF